MHPPTKDQADIGVDNPTIDASNSEDNPDRARQEYKDEADINYMLNKFGIVPPRGAPTYGTWDDSLDLQQAIESTREARAAFKDLPQELQDKFPRMEDLLNAVENGSLVIKDEPAPEEPPKN